ncbi:MAG: argininosuccinate lyase [Thermoproteota archaeon]|nr:argininosuccinate lyase [Thermoproteota archaeon]
MDIDNEIISYDILGTQAHVVMLYEKGLLKVKALKKILNELEILLQNPGKINRLGYEDIHEALETHLVKKLGIEIGGRIQTGRSRNDQVILDVRMKARDELNNICLKIISLIDGILRKAEQNLGSVMPLYTHLQQAQIGNLSHYFLSYSEQLFRDLDRLYLAYTRINKSPLGSGPVGGSSIPIDRERTALLLGFDGLVTNSIDATSSRDTIVELMSALSILMITLSRIAEDLIIWSTQEFDYVELADKCASSSSAMPQKKNPDPLELLRSRTTIVVGNLITSFAILKALPSGYSRDLQDLKLVFLNSLSMVSSCLTITDIVISSLIIHKDRMKDAAINSYANSIDIAEQLVMRKGLVFRTAHKIVGSLVEIAVSKNNAPLSSLSVNEIETVIKRTSVPLRAEELLEILTQVTPEKLIVLRSSTGSSNPDEQKKVIESSKIRVQEYSGDIRKRKMHLSKALRNLRRVVISYVNKSN